MGSTEGNPPGKMEKNDQPASEARGEQDELEATDPKFLGRPSVGLSRFSSAFEAAEG